MKRYMFFVLLVVVLGGLCAQAQFAASIAEGNRLLVQNSFAQAAQRFEFLLSSRDRLSSSEYEDVLTGMAKAQLGLGQFNLAADFFNMYLLQFPQGRFVEEVLYRQARVYFQKEDYSRAIDELTKFLDTYPNSVFEANVYYWIGESLLQFGRLGEAESLFLRVVSEFPTNYRVEAAQYRLEVIALAQHERELRQLLRASNEKIIQQSAQIQELEKELALLLANFKGDLSSIDFTPGESTSGTEGQDGTEAFQQEAFLLEGRIEQLSEELALLFAQLQALKQ